MATETGHVCEKQETVIMPDLKRATQRWWVNNQYLRWYPVGQDKSHQVVLAKVQVGPIRWSHTFVEYSNGKPGCNYTKALVFCDVHPWFAPATAILLAGFFGNIVAKFLFKG